MPFVNAPNIVFLAIFGTKGGEPIMNTWHFRLAAPAALADLQSLATATDTYWKVRTAEWPSDYGVTAYYLRALDTATSPVYETNPSVAISGTAPGTPAPNDVTIACTRYTGHSGRKQRGRIYWPGLTDSMITGTNSVASADLAGIQTYLSGFTTAMAGATPAAHECILHRADGTSADVIGWRFHDGFIDVQRRRLPGHNRHH